LLRFLTSFQFVRELFFADFVKELSHGWTGLHAHSNQVIAGEEGRANFGLFFEFFSLVNQVVVNVQAAMRTEAIETVKLEFERESRAHEHTAEGGFAHLKGVFELHMAADGNDDVIDLFAGKTQAFENLFGHVGTDALMFIEMNGPGLGVVGGGGWFGDVVKKDGPCEGRVCIGGQVFEHQEEMVEDGSFGMKIWRLVTGDGGGDFGQDLFEQAALAKKVESARSVRRAEELDEFVADALGADGVDLGRGGFDSGEGFGFDDEIQLGSEANGAKETKMIFAETFGGRTDGANNFSAQIGFAIDPIVQFPLDRIVEEAVDGEVAAASVSDSIAKNDVGWMASVLVIGFSTKSGDLKLKIVFEDNYDAEFAADRNGAFEKLFDFVRESGGDDVIVAGLAAEEKIANAAADPIGGKAGLLEATDDLSGGFGHSGPIRKTTNGRESTRMRIVEWVKRVK
jgi:hypothetical protein